MAARTKSVEVEVEGRTLTLSNLDKVLYPAAGFTKAEVLGYYATVAPALLPHLGDRALTLNRFPDGPAGPSFFEKNCPGHRPPWVGVHPVRGAGPAGAGPAGAGPAGAGPAGAGPAGAGPADDDGAIDFCKIDSVAALTWVANLAALELHTSMARAVDPDTPTMVVFDLDPGPPAGLLECAEVALRVRAALGDLGLDCVAKTSGSKGLQVYLPLNTPTTYAATSAFSKELAQTLERAAPELVVSVQRKSLRTGKVLVDWSQNSRHKTTVCAYSLRARERPTVSTPLQWDEVEGAAAAGDDALLRFETADVLDRVRRLGDLWSPTLSLTQEVATP